MYSKEQLQFLFCFLRLTTTTATIYTRNRKETKKALNFLQFVKYQCVFTLTNI